MLDRMPRAVRKIAAPKAPRRRKDADEARKDILDAAERRMVKVGPAGIRLQEVARDAGISHPTVLHHFGSREGLVKAVVTRSLNAVHSELVAALAASTGEEEDVASIIEGVFGALASGGHGRVILWLALEGQRVDAVDGRLADVVGATHALRVAKHSGKAEVPIEDTAHSVVLAALALVASTVLGPILLENAGLGRDPKSGVRFRAFLARVLSRHLAEEAP